MLALLIALIISAPVIVYVLWPLIHPDPFPAFEENPLLSLLVRKETQLLRIQELEMDYRMGKLSQQDFEQLNQRLRRRAIQILQQIDRITPNALELEDEIEKAVRLERRATDPEF